MATKVLIKNGTVEDSIFHILHMIREAAQRPFAQQLAAKMKQVSPDVVKQLQFLFSSACTLSYKFDSAGIEQLKTPERMHRDGYGDCDDYTIFQGSVLLSAGIPFKVKVVDWSNDGWDHIYIVAFHNGKKYILDPVTVTSGQMSGGGFNIEKSDFRNYKLYDVMRIEQLSGLSGKKDSPFAIDLSLELPGLRGIEPVKILNSNHERGVTVFAKTRSPLTVPAKKVAVVGAGGAGMEAVPLHKIPVPHMHRARNHFGAPMPYVPRREVLGPKAMFLMLLDMERESALMSEQLCQHRLAKRGIVVPLSGMEGEKPVSELLGSLYEGVAAHATDADIINSNDLGQLMHLCRRRKGSQSAFGSLLEALDTEDDGLSGKKNRSAKKAAKKEKRKERRTKIKNAIKKVGKGILTAVKKVGFAPVRLAFRAMVRASPQVATAFLYSFIDDQAFLAKYPKVAAKKKRADKLIDKFVKVLGFKRDVLLKTFRTAIMKRYKMTPKDYILKMARKQNPDITMSGFGRVRGGGSAAASSAGASVAQAAMQAVPGVSQAMAAKDILSKIIEFFKKIFGGKKEADPEFSTNDLPSDDDYGSGYVGGNAASARYDVDSNEFVPEEDDSYDAAEDVFDKDRFPVLNKIETLTKNSISTGRGIVTQGRNIIDKIDDTQEALVDAGSGVSKISNTLPWIAAGLGGAFIVGMVIYSNSKK